jgi:hypothetical protein
MKYKKLLYPIHNGKRFVWCILENVTDDDLDCICEQYAGTNLES